MTRSVILDTHTCYAGFWRRLLASIIDTLLLLPLLGILLYLVGGPSYFQGSFSMSSPFDASGQVKVSGLAGIFVNHILPIILVVFFWVKFLGTPGKLLLDCHVVHADTGQPLSIGRALLRYLAYYISMLPLMLGFLWVGWDKRKQGFHDKIANSVVVVYDEANKTLSEWETELLGKEKP